MKPTILSFTIKGDVISDHFLMLWFQKDSLNTVGFRTFRVFKWGEGLEGARDKQGLGMGDLSM